MSVNRLELLLRYYEDDPHDPFNIYALAIEYLKSDIEKSRELFDKVMLEHPDYVPTYYHAAKLYQDLGDKEKAISIYEKGIAVAFRNNDRKAHRELQSAYNELMFE
jgi:tetratricopeptide (TPR) repeat protein